MTKLPIYNMAGAVTEEEEIPEELLELKRGTAAVRDVVVAHLAARRRGTASTLSKGEVAGSNRKPWPQKGTGRARAGYRQSPIWRGGGVAFGPHPRKYYKKINKKVRELAFHRVISEKIVANEVKVLNELSLKEAKTKTLVGLFKALNVNPDKGVLLVDVEIDKNVKLAARNIEKVKFAKVSDLNVYELLKYATLVITRSALNTLKEKIGKYKSNNIDHSNTIETDTAI
jgi:large subunit ribosomal protein L4